MADHQPGDTKRVQATVDVLHRKQNGQSLFSLAAPAPAPGPCAGKADDTPCGAGCVCRSGQPWYTLQAMADRGFNIELPDEG